jgi:hypothetical protein
MFFAMKFCHCWRATDFAFAFAHHFYLPPALPGHFALRLPGFAFKQRWFLHQRINSYNVVTFGARTSNGVDMFLYVAQKLFAGSDTFALSRGLDLSLAMIQKDYGAYVAASVG